MSIEQIKESSKVDSLVKSLKEAIRTGKWFTKNVKQFEKIKLEFTEQDDIVLRGSRIVIPENLRSEVLSIVHQGHIGMSKGRFKPSQHVGQHVPTCWRNVGQHVAFVYPPCTTPANVSIF